MSQFVESRRSGLAAAARANWSVLDQGLSSLTNFLIAAAAAKFGTREDFGAFSVGLTIYVLALWVARSVIAEPYVIRLTARREDEQRAAASQAVTAAAGLGALAGALVAAGGLMAGTARGVFVAFGVFLPVLLVQDTYRFVLFASRRPQAAAGADGVWLAVCVAGIAVGGSDLSVTAIAALFGAGAAAGTLTAARLARVSPGIRLPGAWLRRYRELASSFLMELFAVNGMPAVTLLVIALFADLTVMGALRAGLLLVSPVTVVVAGVFLLGAPEAVRARRRGRRSLVKLLLVLGAATSLMVLIWSGLVALLPARSGRMVLGENWGPGRALLLAMTVQTVANCVVLAGSTGLRTLEGVGRSLKLRALAAPVFLAGGVAGNYLAGAEGSAIGIAAGSCVSALLTWATLRKALGAEPAAPPNAEAVGAIGLEGRI